jgi:hypothetical protein
MKLFALLLLAVTSAHAAEFLLYAIKSPKLLDWTTPRSLISTTLRGAIGGGSHQIGHVFVGFKCDGEAEVLSGMTNGPGFNSRTNLLKKKHGMSVLIQDNVGRLQLTEEVQKDIIKLSTGKRMSAMRMEISNYQCLRMKEWYREYSLRSPIIYGGVDKRPLNGEGAGCSAYSMSFFQYADLDFADFNKRFEQTIYVPNELLGSDTFKVGLGTIYGNRKKLAVPAADALEVKLYDPNTMYLWILKQVAEVEKTGKATELPHYQAATTNLNKTKILILKPL